MKQRLIAFGIIFAVATLCIFGVKCKPPKIETAERVRANSGIQSISAALIVYRVKNGFFPTTEQGLKALVTMPTTEPIPSHWSQQFDSVPLDPWGHVYIYECPGKHNATAFDLYSTGPDGKPGTKDDIVNWDAPK